MTDAKGRAIAEARNIQWLIAAVFIGLGAWCLVWPTSVIDLTVRHEYRSSEPLVLISVGAFGAQACLSGLFAGASRFSRVTFIAYGFALLPFFVFDWWVYAVTPIFNELIAIDAVGNVIMLALCVRGYSLLGMERSEAAA